VQKQVQKQKQVLRYAQNDKSFWRGDGEQATAKQIATAVAKANSNGQGECGLFSSSILTGFGELPAGLEGVCLQGLEGIWGLTGFCGLRS
jgi:hypothetical protein